MRLLAAKKLLESSGWFGRSVGFRFKSAIMHIFAMDLLG